MRSPSSAHGLFGLAALLLVGSAALLSSCTGGDDAKSDGLCTPNKPVFCRCRDRQEGQKVCNATGTAFGTCDPCQTLDNPELEGDSDPEPRPSPVSDEDASASARCGDGIVEPGEDCDLKPANAANGCDASCKLAGPAPPASNACPGLPVHVWGGAHQPTMASRTDGSGNRRVSPACGATPTSGSVASDRVFQVVAHKSGTLSVTTSDTNFNLFLYATEVCAADLNVPLVCANETNGVGAESLAFPVESGKTYYVFVDGTGTTNSSGDFRVTFSIP